MRLRLVSSAALLAIACGGAQLEPEFEFPPPAPPAAAPAPEPKAARPPDVLLKADVVAAVDAGLGRYLERLFKHVELTHELNAQGRFVGWRIISFQPGDWLAGVDLKPGDIVTSVNGMPIERDDEGLKAFQALETADHLTLSYLRDGEPRSLEYKIVDKL